MRLGLVHTRPMSLASEQLIVLREGSSLVYQPQRRILRRHIWTGQLLLGGLTVLEDSQCTV